MEYSRLPLQTWLLAVYIMRTAQKKISSVQLAKELDVTQKTAWFIQKRIKKACAESGKNLELYARLLSGKSLVELGDAHLALHAQPSGQEHHKK